MKRPYKIWTNHEESVLRDLYCAGVDVRDISKRLDHHSPDACNRHALHMGLTRPDTYVVPRPNRTWDAIVDAMTTAGKPLDCYEISILTDLHTSVVYARLKERHGKLVRVSEWRVTTRKPAALWVLGGGIDAPKPVKRERVKEDISPFAAAAGLIQAPSGIVGRVYRIRDDELEAA